MMNPKLHRYRIRHAPPQAGPPNIPYNLPQACPEPVEGCQGQMRILAFIEDEEVMNALAIVFALSLSPSGLK